MGLCLNVPAVSANASGQELAQKSQNPVADMISLPIKSKFNFGRGKADARTLSESGPFLAGSTRLLTDA